MKKCFTRSNAEKVVKNILVALLIFIPFRFVIAYYINDYVKLIPDILIFILLLIFLIKKKFVINFIILDILFLLYLLSAFVSTIFINNLSIFNYLIQVRSVGLYYILYFVIRNFKFSKNFYNNILIYLKLSLYIIFLLATIEKIFDKQFLFPVEWINHYSTSNFPRTYSVLNNPNSFGAYVTLIFIINYYITKIISQKFKNQIIFNSIILCSIMLAASLSATLTFCICIGILLFLTFKNNKPIQYKRVFLKTIYSVVIGVLMYNSVLFLNNFYQSSMIDKSNQINNEQKENGSNTTNNDGQLSNTFSLRFKKAITSKYIQESIKGGRLYSINKGVEIYKDHKLWGTGFGTYGSSASKILPDPPKVYQKYNIEKGFYADNEYVKVLVETGSFGAIIFIIFLLSILNYYKNNKYKVAACFVFFGLGALYNVFEIQVLSLFFWFILSIPDEINNDSYEGNA